MYTGRGVDTSALSAGERLAAPLSDSPRSRQENDALSAVAPKFAQLTDEVVFGALWRANDLSPRDRSLVTIAALGAMGDDEQLDAYLRRGLSDGLTRGQIAEGLTHLAFYAGWTRATRAMTAFTRTLAPSR